MTARKIGTIVALILVSSTSNLAQQNAPAPNQVGPVVFNAGAKQRIRVVQVAEGLFHPWSLAFLPDSSTSLGAGGVTMLVAERNGSLRVIRDGTLLPEPAWVAPGQGGDRLHAIAVHPQFAKNGFVYLSHPKTGERGNTLAVSRGRFDGTKLTDVSEIFVADAWESSGNLAGRLLFGRDNTLFVTVGDRDRLCCIGKDDYSIRMKAQALDNHQGKTLRINDDGSVPKDNPFVGRAGAKPEIYTYGHRNGYGLAIHPQTGELWQAEIGPLGGDELNILKAGGNYGWPVVSMGRNYTGTLVSDSPYSQPGMENPRMFWVPSISPSSIAFYTGDKFPAWKGSLLVGALTTRRLLRVSFGNPSQDERRDALLVELDIRPRDVQQGPDGNIYIATERGAQGNTADGTILRIEPAD
jgi:glucose/arabinose dehydrogenase